MSEIYLGTPSPSVVSWCQKMYGPQYMTIEALNDGVNVNILQVAMSQSGQFQVQLNDSDWATVSWEDDVGVEEMFNLVSKADASKSQMSKGDKLRFKSISTWANGFSSFGYMKITGADAKVYGKLADSVTPELAASAQSYKLVYMFMSSDSLTDASGLDLGGITLSEHCYNSMFDSCTALANAPKLSAKTLAGYCYCRMFSGCTSLTAAPALPATTLADDCYMDMFSYCAKINELHYPASIENDSTFTSMSGYPKFGATNATAIFDL